MVNVGKYTIHGILWVQTETTHVYQVTTFMVSTKDGDALLYRLKVQKALKRHHNGKMK